MSWKLSVASKHQVSGWGAEATRLRRFWNVISEQVANQHDQPLVWRNERLTVEQWNDPATMTAEVLEQRLRTADGIELSFGGASRSVTQGHLDGEPAAFVNSQWALGGADVWQFDATQDFYTEDDGSDNGLARHLNDYPVEWLVDLVRQTARSVAADEAVIDTFAMFKAAKKRGVHRRISGTVGPVTFAPNGITTTTLPDTVTVHPGIDTKPDSVILATDLDTAVNDPAALIDDLIAIHTALKPAPTS